MSIELSITDWRSPDSRQLALNLASAQRAAQRLEGPFDDDAILDILEAAINKAIEEYQVGTDWQIDASVQYHPDPNGADQFNIWFRVYPPPPPVEDIPPEGLTEHVEPEPVPESPPG